VRVVFLSNGETCMTADLLCRNINDPRALASIFEKAEADLAVKRHPDPYIRPLHLILRL
jgi:hypothetical protein